MTNLRAAVLLWAFVISRFVSFDASLSADDTVKKPDAAMPLVGYTELKTNLPGGRHANVRTMRAVVTRRDGSQRTLIGEHLTNEPDTWTQFAGWSPDGKTAIIARGWQDPENAKWEEEHKSFRMEPGKWSLDSYMLDIDTGKLTNVTAVDRVSHYNAMTFSPDGKKLLMTSLVAGTSKPFLMDLDGRNKQDVSGGSSGFTYGFSASPDGKLISYHESYQVYIANADGSDKRHIATGNPFNFIPQWSVDGKWLMFVSGEHYNCHPHVVRADGSGLKKLADRGGYRGSIEFLDVFDFHAGSSDLPVWSKTDNSIYYTAKVGESVELFHISLVGAPLQLTNSAAGTMHYHPQTSLDGKWLIYGSKREGVRQIFIRNLESQLETRVTDLTVGHAAMWPHLQPVTTASNELQAENKRRTRRVMYNFDGDSCMTTKAGGLGSVDLSEEDLKRLIDEVAYEGSQVDTVLVCVNAQVMYYPTKVGTMRGTLSTDEEKAKWPVSEQQRFKNMQKFFDAGVDPYAVMFAETKRRGGEALIAFRMNDDHGNDFLRTQFWVDHPECRLGKGALDFGRDEVRDYSYMLIEEALRRYDCDGIELDFNRFPNFFKDGTADERIAKMNVLVERVRKLLDDLGRERGRRLVLGVRVPSNYGRTPPTPESSRELGCDVPHWAKSGWVDFVTVSEFLFTRYDLPLKPWKAAIPDVPVYGGIECTEGGAKEQYLTAEKYRHAAKLIEQEGADGIYLFNFFTTREYGPESWEPPFEVLKDLSSIKH